MNVDEDGWKWMKMDKMDEMGWKWVKVDENGWKRMKVDESGWNWMKVNESGWKWMKVDERGWKRMKVVESGWNIRGATSISDTFFFAYMQIYLPLCIQNNLPDACILNPTQGNACRDAMQNISLDLYLPLCAKYITVPQPNSVCKIYQPTSVCKIYQPTSVCKIYH